MIKDSGGLGPRIVSRRLNGISPFWIAAWFDQPAAIDLLLSYGKLSRDDNAICAAVTRSADVLSRLHNAGATIYDKDLEDEYPLLLVAARHGNLATARLLLSWHAELVYTIDVNHRTALHVAASGGHLEICRMLLEFEPDGAKVKDYQGWQALHFAAEAGHGNIVELLLDRSPESILDKATFGTTALHLAAGKDQRGVVELLLSRDPTSLTFRDGQGRLALHHAVETGQQSTVNFFLSQDPGLVNMPIIEEMNMPLHIAAYKGNETMMKLLVQAGAKTEPRNKDGETAADLLLEYKLQTRTDKSCNS